MEMSGRHIILKSLWAALFFLLLILSSEWVAAQSVAAYSIKNGRMYIQMDKMIKADALDSFVTNYGLEDLDLKNFLRTNREDSLKQLGWKVEINNESYFIISKGFEPFGNIHDAINNIDRILFENKPNPLFPATDNGVVFGVNKFRNKYPFPVNDSLVTFFLRGNKTARQVMLAGSFNDWDPAALSMSGTDTGWIAYVKLRPGKYWYKFVIDGNWVVDNDNQLRENDGLGNINSVYYRPNIVFSLPGHQNAKRVFLSGSFNNWKRDELSMTETPTGWQLPLYLAEGTHTYKYVVDGRWVTDDHNTERLPDGHGSFNSVIRLGKPHHFVLQGFENARKVVLSGSFNEWKEDELPLSKTAFGWELSYTLGPGNYEYKFIVDGKWMTDPVNPVNSTQSGNSYLVIDPNYTFRLKGYAGAKTVFLAGDFNRWDPKAYAMKKEGDEWVFPVHLTPGKHLYKFIVDNQWMNDPANPLWEQNEYGTGNSVLWIGR